MIFIYCLLWFALGWFVKKLFTKNFVQPPASPKSDLPKFKAQVVLPVSNKTDYVVLYEETVHATDGVTAGKLVKETYVQNTLATNQKDVAMFDQLYVAVFPIQDNSQSEESSSK